MSIGDKGTIKTASLNLIFDNIKKSLKFSKRTILSYKTSAIVGRLLQEINETFLTNKDVKNRGSVAVSLENSSFLNNKIDIKGIGVLPDGSVRISIRLLLFCFVKFNLYWLFCLLCIVKPGGFINKNSKVCLMYGIPELSYINNINGFIKCCKKSPIESIASSDYIFVESVKLFDKRNSAWVNFSKSPLLDVIKYTKIGFISSFRLILSHLSMLFLVQFYCIRHPFLWLFWKDFTEHSIVKELNSKGILNGVVYTNSNMNTEPLWATDLCGRKFKTSIALYSLNMFTLRGKKSLIRDAPPPIFGLLRSDEIFIWLPECEKILRNEGLKIKTRVAPPILWLYSEPLKKTIHSHKFNISLYDVTPGKFIDSDFYYSFEIMKEFTASVINAVKRVNNDYGCEIQIFHKYKRPPIRGVHDDRYIDYIDAVSTESNIFTSVNNTNVYDLLSRTDLSIVAPYSSVAYIASDLKINSVFYDPLSLLVKDYIETPYINFIDNENDLYNFIGGLYRNKMKIYSGVANESV